MILSWRCGAHGIMHCPAHLRSGIKTDAFAYVSDVAPTLLELAGVKGAGGKYRGRDVHKITGNSME